MKQSRKFIAQQAQVLASLSYSESDIARTLRWVEAHMPPDANERTWTPAAADLQDDVLDNAAVEDARLAWMRSKSVPRQYNTLLDAVEGD